MSWNLDKAPAIDKFAWEEHEAKNINESPDAKLDAKLGKIKPDNSLEESMFELGQSQYEATGNKIDISGFPENDRDKMLNQSWSALTEYNRDIASTRNITDPEKKGEALRQALERYELTLSSITGVIDGSKAKIDQQSQRAQDEGKAREKARRALEDIVAKFEKERENVIVKERWEQAMKITRVEIKDKEAAVEELPRKLNLA